MRRMIVLAALMMAVVLVLSAPMAEAKKKKKHHHRHNSPPAPAFNVVQCPTESDGLTCNGTASNDYLVGRDTFDKIFGGEGNDVYDGKGGGDFWLDTSATSSDYYLVSVPEFGGQQMFGGLRIGDDGGGSDTLDLSRFYTSYNFAYDRSGNDLIMIGTGSNDVRIFNFFTKNTMVDSFKFSDKTLTGADIAAMVP